MERECYEEEVQPCRKMDNKPIIYYLPEHNVKIIEANDLKLCPQIHI